MLAYLLGLIGFVVFLSMTQWLEIQSQILITFVLYAIALAAPLIEKRKRVMSFRDAFTQFMRPVILTHFAVFAYLVFRFSIINPEHSKSQFEEYKTQVEISYHHHNDSLQKVIISANSLLDGDSQLTEVIRDEQRQKIANATRALSQLEKQYTTLSSNNPFSIKGRFFSMLTTIVIFSILGLLTAAFFKSK
jgi:cell division protein FtsB